MELATRNARNRIEFGLGDFFLLEPSMKIDNGKLLGCLADGETWRGARRHLQGSVGRRSNKVYSSSGASLKMASRLHHVLSRKD
ncbi:hypothetical protein E2562_026137 [Oryza meyeriana var. granulata]|uniref:Uncharacterized protein n=1 Tax=Oryza meyeriana var. granulata TaxID=110450 RepID=A0A6G1FCI9_9ORYZ|nr:hypothetical protein E2562_026137 [Oryza meyeriana var. granulata]